MMCLLIKFICIIGQVYILSHNWREELQVIISPLNFLDFFHFPGELIISSAMYGCSITILLSAHGVTGHTNPWLVCVQSKHQRLINGFKLQLHYRKIKAEKHIPLAEIQPSHLCFRALKIIICAGVFTCYWNFPASIQNFVTVENEGTMVHFLWLSEEIIVARWKINQK